MNNQEEFIRFYIRSNYYSEKYDRIYKTFIDLLSYIGGLTYFFFQLISLGN